jgi:hypothetical protein
MTRRAFQIYTSGPRQTPFDRAVIAFSRAWFDAAIEHIPPNDSVVATLQWLFEMDSQRIYRLLRDLEVHRKPAPEPKI